MQCNHSFRDDEYLSWTAADHQNISSILMRQARLWLPDIVVGNTVSTQKELGYDNLKVYSTVCRSALPKAKHWALCVSVCVCVCVCVIFIVISRFVTYRLLHLVLFWVWDDLHGWLGYDVTNCPLPCSILNSCESSKVEQCCGALLGSSKQRVTLISPTTPLIPR